MRGRKPNSDATNALRGNPGKRRREPEMLDAADQVDTAPLDAWSAPQRMAAGLRAVWRREMERLREAGFVKVSDLSAFEVYVVARHRWERANAVIARRGPTYRTVTKHGAMERLRPEMSIIAQAERTMRTYQEGLAMTTAGRLRASAQIPRGQGALPLPLPPVLGAGQSAKPAAPPQLPPADFDPLEHVRH